MTKERLKKVARHAIAIGGALAGGAELFDIFELVTRCSFGVPAHEAKRLALWLCIVATVTFRFPSEYRMYYRNTLFKPSKPTENQEEVKAIALRHKILSYSELAADGLSAVIAGGLSFDSAFSLLNSFKHYQLPSILKYMMSGALGVPSAIATFGVNRANSLSHAIIRRAQQQQAYQEIDAGASATYLCLCGYNFLFFALPALIAALGHGFETFYNGEVSLENFISDEPLGAVTCSTALMNFSNLGQILAFVAVGILAVSMSFKAAVIEGLHVKKAHEKNGGFSNWFKKIFSNILLGCGNLIASFLHTVPALAAIATLPIDAFSKTFLLSAIFLLDGLVGSFVEGKYWQELMEELISLSKSLAEKIKSCCYQRVEQEHLPQYST